MNDGLIRKEYPRPHLMISRTMVLCFGAALAFIIVLAIATRKAPSELHQTASDEGKAAPSHVISFLPSTYSDIPPEKVAISRKPERSEQSSDLEKLLAQMLAERQKRAEAARTAPLTFQGLNISDRSVSALPFDSKRSSDEQNPHPPKENQRDSDNRQDDKSAFLSTKRPSDIYLGDTLHAPHSEYQLMAGSLVPGVLLTGLNSDLPGQILGQVSQNVYDTVTGNYLLVPQGTKVLGEYDSRIVYGQERLLIVWTRLIFPNGRSISLEGMPGVDLSGAAGLTDQVNNHYLRLLTGVVFSSLLGATAQMAEGQNYDNINPSYGQLATQGAARNLNDVGQQITRRNLAVQPTLEIRPGFRFNVFVHKDVILEPYDT